MKIISTKTLPNGKLRTVVETDAEETLLAIVEDQHYKLGYPLEDVVGGHVIAPAERVNWCSIEQKWI